MSIELYPRKKLPAYKQRRELIELVNSNQVVVVSGETGCGKTTQVPQFVLDDHARKNKFVNIVVTQPRRIAAQEGWNSIGQHILLYL